ncbi:MAG: metallophosphoesterase [Desulfurococcaceae archaeon]
MTVILSTSDVHSPENLPLYLEALKNTSVEPDLILFAGDMVDRNRVFMLKPVIDATLKKHPNAKIIGVFGNEEYRGFEKLYVQMYKEVTWLNDEYIVLDNKEICIIGTRGALDKPTMWQARNIPGIEKYYFQLPFKIEQMAIELRKLGCRRIILLSHYGVTHRNLAGEREESYPYLACSRFERIIKRDLFDIVIHGHVHMGIIELITIRNVPVYNVSLPARRKLVEIQI